MNAPPSEWTKFARELHKSYSPRNDDVRFSDYAWDDFSRDQAVKVLLDKNNSYYGHKEILFAAFCAWMIQPKDHALRKAMILKALVEVLARIENKISKLLPHKNGVGEVLVRLDDSIRGLYEDIYYPIGGISAIINNFDEKISAGYQKRAQTALTVVEIVRCLHYISSPRFHNPRYLSPSLVRVSEVLASSGHNLQSKAMDKDNTRKQMDARRMSASILYAFSSVKDANDPDDLLVATTRTFPNWNKVAPHFSRIIRRAQFIEDTVLSRTKIQSVGRF